MLSPAGRMSKFQKAQMYSLQDKNIFNIAVQGSFDDAQDIVKAVSGDLTFKTEHHIGAVNSINWARLRLRSSTTSVLGCRQPNLRMKKSRSPSPRATSVTS